MKPLWWMRGTLMDAAGADGAAGGGDGAGQPVIDWAAREAALMEKVNKTINGAVARIEKAGKKPEPEPAADLEPDASGQPAKKTAAEIRFERELAKLRGELDTEKKARGEATEAARREKRNTTLTTELGKLGVSPERMKTALRAIDPDVKWSEDGSLVGEDESPLGDYLKTWITSNEHFLPAKPVGGAGAGAGSGRRGEAVLTTEEIRPGMKPEDAARIGARLAEMYAASR